MKRQLITVFALVNVVTACRTTSSGENAQLLDAAAPSAIAPVTCKVENTAGDSAAAVIQMLTLAVPAGAGAVTLEGAVDGTQVKVVLDRDSDLAKLSFESARAEMGSNVEGVLKAGMQLAGGTLNDYGSGDSSDAYVTCTRGDIAARPAATAPTKITCTELEGDAPKTITQPIGESSFDFGPYAALSADYEAATNSISMMVNPESHLNSWGSATGTRAQPARFTSDFAVSCFAE